jgi:hypothetical protein
MNKIHKGKVKRGKFKPHDHASFIMEFASREGQDVEVIVRKAIKRRSNNQNRYYHGVVVPLIAEATGYSKEEAHDALKVHFLTDMTGTLPKVGSTAGLTTVEFLDFIAQVQQFASESLGIFIPDPDEVSL